MKGYPGRRQAALEKVAAQVLKVGLRGISLRPLASSIGTSDRMLLYYFSNKDELIAETVRFIAGQLLGLLEAERLEPAAYDRLLPTLYALLIRDDFRPYMQVWYELVAFSSRNEEPYRSVAAQVSDGFLAWITGLLIVENEADARPAAALLLSALEGLLMLESLGKSDITTDALTRFPPAPDSGRR
jgi:AcrR family transcriptional regulator